MATFVLIPGAGSDSWYWSLVAPLLRADGHDVVAVDLPCADDAKDFGDYADVVIDEMGRAGADPASTVVVAQSLGGFTAALVAARQRVGMVVLLAAMVPGAHERPDDWWTNTGHRQAYRDAAERGGWSVDEFDEQVIFLHDVPPDVAADSAEHVCEQSGTPLSMEWPLGGWPDVPTRFLLCRDDRFFPAEFQRKVVAERLGIVPDEMSGGHLPALAHPDELAGWLLRYASELEAA
jgi:pimeloyl-ACP methyl ester carboxylesterase